MLTCICFIICLCSVASLALPQQLLLHRQSSRPSPGCGKTHVHLGFTAYRDIRSSDRDRSYSIHLPLGYDRNRAYPTIFGFHGSSSIGFFFEADSKFSELRFTRDKIMVYPTGVNGSWAGPSYASVPVAEDLQFVEDVLADVKESFCVDEKRVYATGISNGGGFVNDIACSETVGRQFAAFAPASGSFYTDVDGPHNACKPSRSPLPLLEIHGGNDGSVPYAGGQGEGGLEPSITDWLGFWEQRNGCTEKRQEDTFGGDVHHITWTCKGIVGALQHWKVDSMGHCWASTEINFSQLSVPELPTHIQANDIILRFFDRFSLP